jgi:hypothetical protein
MPCDSVILGEHPISETPNHCSVAHAMSNGWMFQIDCYGRSGKGYVYNSSTISEEKALNEYMEKNENLIKNHRKIKFKSGYYRHPFNRNYCLIGNCAGFAEPLEATGYTIILNTINLLIKNHFDKKSDLLLTNSEIRNNNGFIEKTWAEVINIILMHYKFNDNYKNDFWDHCNNLNFYGDFKYVIEYLLENNFNLQKVKELKVNYLNNIFIPVEAIYFFLKAKNIIKKEKKEKTNLFDFFKNKSDMFITYDDLINEKKYKNYFDNTITIDNFLNN